MPNTARLSLIRTILATILTWFTRFLASALVAAAVGLPSAANAADPGNYFVNSYDNEGKWDLSFHYWDIQRPSGFKLVWPEVGLGYGVTDAWYTRVFVSGVGRDLGHTTRDSINWQNDIRLTSGQSPYDLSLHTKLYGYADGAEGRGLEMGPAFQSEWGLWRVNANVFFNRSFGAAKPSPTQLTYQWRVLYPLSPGWHWGAVGMGELGTWDHWASSQRQSHRAGPTLTGSWSLTGAQTVQSETAYLMGSVEGKTGNMLMVTLRYRF